MLPSPPGMHGIVMLALTVGALYLFTRDRLPLQTSSLIVLTALVLGFELFPYRVDGQRVLAAADFFAGFGNTALITIGALLVCAKALETTGAFQPLALWLARAWAASPKLAFLATLVLAAMLSMFLNNTPIVVMLLPILVGVSLRAGINASSILMPVGYATILGGMATTIGTSTNLLVVSIATQSGVREFEMFDFLLPASVAAAFGIVFLWGIAPRLLPERTPPMSDTSPRIFSAMLHINEGSTAAGRRLMGVLKLTDNRMRIERIERGEGLFIVKLPSVKIQPGDRLYVADTPERLKEFEKLLGATLYSASDAEHPIGEGQPLKAAGQKLAEVVVTPGSPLHHRTLRSTRFAVRYKLLPLAIHRPREESIEKTTDLADVVLRGADILLVQGASESIQELKDSGTMLVLDGTTDLPHTKRAPLAMLIMISVVLVAALDILPIAVSALCGAGLMLVTGCLSWRGVLDALDTKLVLLIVASLGLGTALMRTGGTEYLGQLFAAATSDLPVAVILALLILLMALFTEVVTNNAAAVLGTPIAVSIANQLGVDPEPFVLGVLFGANMSYLTPIGYQTNLLVLSAGGYRFSDFVRVGIPLQIIVWLVLAVMLPVLYGL